MDDDDLDYDEAAQDDSRWVQWARPGRISDQIERLFAETLRTVPDVPWWDTASSVRCHSRSRSQ
ncbi:hypothetical protein [Nocardia alni]|uniref:hypothetical protein n=1 Tax=Nocardia alni TaxID=2815723 RepID=UPI001C21624C|nr:hypothetical protein [Nocardia alni]